MAPIIRKLFLAIVSAALATSVWWVWYFAEHIHREVVSPDGRTRVIVTKRMDWSPEPVSMGLRVRSEQGLGPEAQFDGVDMWADVTDQSYPVRWLAPDVLQVGDQRGEFQYNEGVFRIEGHAVVEAPRDTPKSGDSHSFAK